MSLQMLRSRFIQQSRMQPVWPVLVTQNRHRHLLTAGMEVVMTEVMIIQVMMTEATTVMTAEITETNITNKI